MTIQPLCKDSLKIYKLLLFSEARRSEGNVDGRTEERKDKQYPEKPRKMNLIRRGIYNGLVKRKEWHEVNDGSC